MQTPKITLAVLTWKAPQTLESSLNSLYPILDFFDERLLVCQESDPREINIGEKFDFKIIKLQDNVGIQNGIKICFDQASNEFVLFLENDLHLKLTPENAHNLLIEASNLLKSKKAEFAKLRFLPERRTDRSSLFDRYWHIKGDKVVRRPIGYLRFRKANWVLSTSTCLIHKKALSAPGFERVSENFLLSTTQYNKWENLGLLTSKSFMSKLLRFAEDNPTSRSINGAPDLEHPLNCKANRKWLQDQKTKLLIATPGLFGHRRFDRPEDDEKWDMVDPADEGGEVIKTLDIPA